MITLFNIELVQYLSNVPDRVACDSKPQTIVVAHIPIGVVYPALTNSTAAKHVSEGEYKKKN